MKLIFIGNTAWSMYNFRRPLFQYYLGKGYEVIVASPSDGDYHEQLEELGCRCYDIGMQVKGNNPVKDFATMWQIRKILKKEKPDCCFFYTIKPNIYGSIAAANLSIPYVPITTGQRYVLLVDNWVSRIAKLLYKLAFRKAKQVWFLNEDDVSSFKEAKLIDESKISILKGEGIDVNRFEVHHETKEISFLLVARMLWDKGVGEFVEAAKILKKKYPNIKFKLLGAVGVENPSAISNEKMDEWIKEGYIEYLGVTSDVRPYLYDSTCVVLPSYREGIPFSLMEGAAAGKPLVATNAVGCKEVVEDGVTGFLCRVKDVQSLADCMEKIVLMPAEDRNVMGMKGRNKVQTEFGIDVVIMKYNCFLTESGIINNN